MRRVRVLHRSSTFGREQRVAELIRRELADLIRLKMRDPRICPAEVLVSEVRVAKDLTSADVYLRSVDVSPEPDDFSPTEFIAIFQSAAGFLRTALARRLSMRTTPELHFHYDDLDEQGKHIDDLLDAALIKEHAAEELVHE